MKKAKYYMLLFFASMSVLAKESFTTCEPSVDLQKCIDNAPIKIIRLSKGIYNVSGIHLNSNTTLVIPKGSVVRLADDAPINNKAFGGTANFVLASIGTPDNIIENVNIVVDGEIDANKASHPYENGGVEGIDWKWVKNSSISGSGTIHSANGDGIDIDSTFDSVISNVIVRNNGDSGIHFGSARPIVGSKNNVVIGVTSINNGFRIGKSGFDLSWPNPDGVVYINCTAIDNYRNFQIEASGGAIYNGKSVDSGKVVLKDDIKGANYAIINDVNVTNKAFLSKKLKVLIERDVRKFFGIKYHKYLDDVEYD